MTDRSQTAARLRATERQRGSGKQRPAWPGNAMNGMPAVRLGLEAHSRRFHFGPDAEPLDEQRDLRAAACGWELLYLGWYATQRPTEVLAMVEDVVAARRRGM